MQHHARPDGAGLPAAGADRPWPGRLAVRFRGRRYLDGISSWWTNVFGHANPRINAVLKEQLETSNTSCSPASPTSRWWSCRTFVGPDWRRLGHAFCASDGASATEIALKMSFHYWRNVGRPESDGSSASPAATTAKRRRLAVTDVAIFGRLRAAGPRATSSPSPDFRQAKPGESPADAPAAPQPP